MQLTNNEINDDYPEISGDYIVWRAVEDNKMKILMNDGKATNLITDKGHSYISPQISGKNVVWHSYDESEEKDFEIFYWNNNEIKQITDNDYNDSYPKISLIDNYK